MEVISSRFQSLFNKEENTKYKSENEILKKENEDLRAENEKLNKQYILLNQKIEEEEKDKNDLNDNFESDGEDIFEYSQDVQKKLEKHEDE